MSGRVDRTTSEVADMTSFLGEVVDVTSFLDADRGLSSAASVAILVAVTFILGIALAVFLFLG